MNPTGLPELSKPLRDLNFDQKREKLKFQNFEKKSKNRKNRHDYLLFSVLTLLSFRRTIKPCLLLTAPLLLKIVFLLNIRSESSRSI